MRALLLSLALVAFVQIRAQEWNWAVDAGGGGNTDFCWGIATDSQGNAYWAGSISGSAEFGCTTVSPPQIAGVLAKYDSTGACQWATGITVNFNEAWAYGVAIDAQDRIYVTGSYDGNATFNNGVTLNSLGSDDIFLARYDTEGNCLWARRAGASGANDEARAVAVNDSGDVFIAGFCGGGTITFDTISIPNPSNYRQLAIACYDSTGAIQWARTSTGNGQSKNVRAISVVQDRLYVTGTINYASAEYDGLTITPNTISALYVLACDLSGHALWVQSCGSGDHEGLGIAADTLGNVFVSGRFWGTIHLPNGDSLVSASSNDDILLMLLDTAGGFHWARRAGSSQRDVGWGVEADGLGNAYVAAHFQQTIDFLGTPLTSDGEEDIILARVDQWGTAAWVKQGGAFERDVAIAIHRSNVGSRPIYTGGYFWGTVTYGSSTIEDVANGDAMMIQLSDTTATDFSTTVRPLTDDAGLLLFPSPASDHLFLRYARPVSEMWIVSPLGISTSVRYDASGMIDIRPLATGVHVLRVALDDGRVIGRPFVKE
jgi:hypothetical protein